MSKRPNFSKSEVVALSAIHEKETVRASYAIFDDDDGGDGDGDVVGVVEDNYDNVNKVDGDDDEDDGHDHNVDKDHSACVQQVNGVNERMTRRMMVAMVMTLMMIGMSISAQYDELRMRQHGSLPVLYADDMTSDNTHLSTWRHACQKRISRLVTKGKTPRKHTKRIPREHLERKS